MLSVKIKKHGKSDKNLTATGVVILVIVALLVTAYISIDTTLRKRSISRMEECVKTITEEVEVKLQRDSQILNATAEMLQKLENLNIETASQVLKTNDVIMETIQARVLLPDNSLLSPDGSIEKISPTDISFEEEAKLGEHISERSKNIFTGVPILRHFVPIVRDGETVAMLYGILDLDELPESLNNQVIYDASASVYIIDTRNGDFLLDTYPTHKELGNISDFNSSIYPRKTKGKLSWEDYTNDILARGTGYVIFRTQATNGWDYMYYSPMGINDWSIAVEIPESVAFESVFLIRKMCFILGIIMAGVIIVYYLWVRRNSKQMTEQAVEQAVLTEKLRKAEAADRAKSLFLSNMSHDIRTPMNAIIGYTTLVQTCLDNREKTEEYLGKILSSGNHMLSLVNDILDMSRIESGKLNIEEKNCFISDIFKDMRNIIQPQMHSKQLNFYMDTIDVINEEIYCDKLHVNQVLLNLLSNAIKFTPSGGTVALTVRQKPSAPKGYGAYEIRVKDTGIGMSRDFIEHIFEPFERERNTTASGIQGTGLGMAITKNIVDAMGGTITVNSEQGKGTEFVIDLEFRLQSEPKKAEDVGELKGLHALIADDNFVTCDSVSKMLRQIGMSADWVLHGKEAVLHAKQAHEMGEDYHVYIIDWFLPDLNGLEVVRQIREIIGDATPIIIIAAYDWTDIEDEAKAAGVTAFCSKPIFLSELRDILVNAAMARVSSAPKENVPDKLESIAGKRLLIVEDNELNREIAEELLLANGFLIDKAEDGSIAVEKVKNSEHGYYSLILMDIQMPVMNGYEAAKAIRALDDKELASIPIVAMTANAFDEDKQQALESGMNAHVAKPFDIDKLIELLIEILEQNAKDGSPVS